MLDRFVDTPEQIDELISGAVSKYSPDEARNDHGEWASDGGQVSDAEVSSLRAYTNASSSAINDHLRTGYSLDQIGQSDLKNIDAVFGRSGIPEKMMVMRTIDPYGWQQIHGDKLKPGDVISDKGFVSTTTSPALFENRKNDYAIEIHLPKGYRAINMSPLSVHPNESEVLLNRGGRFKVKSIKGRYMVLEALK